MYDTGEVDLARLASSARVERSRLLDIFPRLGALQQEIDDQVAQGDSLNSRLAALVSASERFRSSQQDS